MLVENPNPDDPLNYPICLEATEFFKQNSMDDLREKYGGVADKGKESDEDDDIIVVDD